MATVGRVGNNWQRRRSTWLVVVLLFAVLLLLPSCQFVTETQINPDGSGIFQEAQIFPQEEEKTAKETCDEHQLWSNYPTGVSYSEQVHKEEVYCTRSRSFSSLERLKQFYTSWDGLENAHVTVTTLKIADGTFTFDVTLDVTQRTMENEPYPSQSTYEIQLIPPGTIGRNNADIIKGQKLVWDVEPGQAVHLYAESTLSNSRGIVSLLQWVGSHLPSFSLTSAVLLSVLGGAQVYWLWSFWTKRRIKRKIKNIQQKTAQQREKLSDIEELSKQVNEQLAQLFQKTYTQAVSDLETINHLRQQASLSKEEKELLEKLEERHMHAIDQQLSGAYQEVIAQFAARLKTSE